MAPVVPTGPIPKLVVCAALADFVAGAIYAVIAAQIVAIATGHLALPEGYVLDPGTAWLLAPTGAMLSGIGVALVFTGVQLLRGREWVRAVQWVLSITLAILAVLGMLRGQDALCAAKLVCAVIPMVVLRLRHVRSWFDSPYARTKRPRARQEALPSGGAPPSAPAAVDTPRAAAP